MRNPILFCDSPSGSNPDGATSLRRALPLVAGIALFSIGCSGMAHAAGFALRDQSATAMANAFAGATAGADDLSYMFYNPAALTRQTGSQITVGGTAILPNLKIRNGQGTAAGGTPIGGNAGGSNAGENGVIPILYGLLDLRQVFDLEQNVKLGVGVNVPFGLETDYRDGWTGRYYALHSKISMLSVTPTLAWEVLDGFSVAGGLNVQHVDARLTNAIDFGSIGQAVGIPGAAPMQQDGGAKVSGDDIGYGYNLGILYEPWVGSRIGVAYRSAIHHTLRGNSRFSLDSAGVGAALQTQGLFQDGNVTADVTTPESLSFGVYHELTDEWALMGEGQFTRWSRFKHLTLQFDNPAQPTNITDHDWKDTWFFAAGATWRPNQTWTLRGGAAFDQSPIPNKTRTPRIPTDDRYLLSFGANYNPFPNFTVDFSYMHLFSKNGSINLSASDQDSPFVGNFSGDAAMDANVLAVQVHWKF